MATLAATAPYEEPVREERFFSNLAIFMALVIVAGFSTQFLAGRSTFASPLRVHFHAIAFMGWTAIFVTQSWLATRGPMALHRKLGWVAVAWMALMVTAGLMVITAVVRNGTSPFFFQRNAIEPLELPFKAIRPFSWFTEPSTNAVSLGSTWNVGGACTYTCQSFPGTVMLVSAQLAVTSS